MKVVCLSDYPVNRGAAVLDSLFWTVHLVFSGDWSTRLREDRSLYVPPVWGTQTTVKLKSKASWLPDSKQGDMGYPLDKPRDLLKPGGPDQE